MRFRTLLMGLILATLAVVTVSGCKESGPSTRVFVKKAMGQRLRIAVLPFDNVSREQDAGRIITSTVITYLLSTGDFDVVEPGVVYASLASEGIRTTEGLTSEACQKLSPKVKADAFIVGLVEDYGEVRIGPDSYPSVSFSARLIDARTSEILWAATISKTGAENVKLFDIGRISSLGKLSKIAVKSMADSLAKSKGTLETGLNFTPSSPGVIPVGGGTAQVPVTDAAGGHGTSVTPVAQTSGKEKYLDENASYGETGLKGLLKDLGDAKVGDMQYKKHFHDQVETKYTLPDGKFVEVKLVDYLKVDTAKKFLDHYNPGAQASTFESLPAYVGDTQFEYYHIDTAPGRFGLFIRGPKAKQAQMESLAKGLIGLLK